MDKFERIEQKYVLDKDTYSKLFDKIKDHLRKDKYYKSTICNIYLDNNNELIINSLEKPTYKEKVRLRSYGVPELDDMVFLELKKKYNGVVYKRRVEMKLKDYYSYMTTGIKPFDSQIMNEIDYVIKKNHLTSQIFIAYDRISYFDKDNKDFRITFDTNLRSRYDELKLELGDSGFLYSKDFLCIMELKIPNAIPMWFTKILSELKIYPESFSKYGSIYKKICSKEKKEINKKEYNKTVN